MAVTGVSTTAALGERRSTGVGVLAGLLTLAASSIFFWQQGTFSSANTVAAADVEVGQCVNLHGNEFSPFEVVSCSTPHSGEIAALVEPPDPGEPYPGDQTVSIWFEQVCAQAAADYVGAAIDTTTLTSQSMPPIREAWDDGSPNAVCYVTALDEAEIITGSVQGRAEDFRQPSSRLISDLAAGECFSPSSGVSPYDLRSGDTVEVVACEDNFHGVFFGRADLPFAPDAEFPGAETLSTTSTATCSTQFEKFFDVESSVGFSFRFWRPSHTAWDVGSREVLCAVMSEDALETRYIPADYPALSDLGIGQCFVLLPEQSATSLSLDEHVRNVVCADPHVGQMIGGGLLPTAGVYPGDAALKKTTERECSRKFTEFVGISPNDSSYGHFPFWYPDENSWTAGDRRFACAILSDETMVGSIQDSRN